MPEKWDQVKMKWSKRSDQNYADQYSSDTSPI